MQVEIVTKADLQQFRAELLNDLKGILGPHLSAKEPVWLRSGDVRKLLKISPNTLQQLRVTGKLHPAKVGGIFYYKQDEITILLDQSLGQKGGQG